MRFICSVRSSADKFILIILLLLISPSCKDDPVKPPDNVDFSINIEDVSCIEAWISLKAASASELKLFRNDSLINTINIFPLDTIIYDERLLPNQAYTYKAEVLFNNKTYTKEAITRTLDTTSHNFTWQSWEFGEYTHSYLKDIAIIDENNIWAVGAIYMNDSLGQPDPSAYNAVHWNGEKWELKRILYLNGFAPITSIYAFNQNDIWFGIGYTIHWDGAKFKESEIPDWHITLNKIWGTSSENIYVVGNNGSLAHYNGTSWQRIESGTDVDLNDIFGTPDGKVIWIGGYTPSDVVLLKIENNIVSTVFEGTVYDLINNRYVGDMISVWTNSLFGTYYLNAAWGEIAYQRTSLMHLNPKILADNIRTYMYRMRGTASNNIFLAGENGEIGHFNGINYKKISSIEGSSYTLKSIDVKNSIIAAAGDNYQDYANSKALIVVGKK